MKYRSEIDGLRSVAVVPVVLFHAGVSQLSGGFAGVDVFFVISGYLITAILLKEMEQGTFSLVTFYERRARRILPALFVVLAACLPVAWLVLRPDDMMAFARSLIAVAVFSSNILFWRESGYFDAASELSPLLHTWSLAVEEQFYIVFPLVLMAGWRFGKTVLVAVLAGGFLLSLVAAHYGATRMPSATFFLLPTRAWELLIGSLGAFYLHRRAISGPGVMHDAFSALGLGMILYSFVAFDETTPFPSLYTLLPTVGTVLIILFCRPGTVVHRLLSQPLLVGLGLISYSLYLWHQPVFAFARHHGAISPDLTHMLVLAAACVCLAIFTFYLVEEPLRGRSSVFDRKAVFAGSGAGLTLLLVLGVAGQMQSGFRDRYNLDETLLAMFENSAPAHQALYRFNILEAYNDKCNFFEHDAARYGTIRRAIAPECTAKADPDLPSVFIWGDSHAQHLHSGVRGVTRGQWNLLQVATSGCSPKLLDRKMRSLCRRSNETALAAIRRQQPEVVILGTVKSLARERLQNLALHLKSLGVEKVLVAGPSPRWHQSLPFIAADKDLSVGRRTMNSVDHAFLHYDAKLRRWAKDPESAFSVFSPTAALCNSQGCLTYLGEDKVNGLTSFDYGHLMPVASAYVAREVIAPKLEAYLADIDGLAGRGGAGFNRPQAEQQAVRLDLGRLRPSLQSGLFY